MGHGLVYFLPEENPSHLAFGGLGVLHGAIVTNTFALWAVGAEFIGLAAEFAYPVGLWADDGDVANSSAHFQIVIQND